MALPLGFKVHAHQQCRYPECRGKQGTIVSVEQNGHHEDGMTADVYLIHFPEIGEYRLTLGDFFAAPNDDPLKP